MVTIESKLIASDNAGGVNFKIITVFGGFKRKYAGLGEMVGTVVSNKKVYRKQTDKTKLAKLAKKVKKKRKIKNKKKRQPNLRPYLGLLVGLKKWTHRKNGFYIKADDNRMFTFTEPTRFGPAGKTENIPNLVATRVKGPAILELVRNKVIRNRFMSVINKAGGIV